MKWAGLLIVAMLAGCAAEEPSNDGDTLSDGTPVAFGDADVTADTGAITGIIVDTAIVPVAGLDVVLTGLGTATTTDEEGLFVFEGLDPGAYFLEATGDGYLPTQFSADVRAGEVTKVKAQIAIDPKPQPYHATVQFDWFDDVGIVLADFVIDLVDEAFLGDQLPNQCAQCFFDFSSEGPVETFVVEADWTEAINDPSGETSFYWNLAQQDDWGNYEDDYFDQADPAYIGDNRFGNLTEFTVSMYGDETWVSIDQHAELYVTMFYVDPAPEGWSFIRGDP